MDTIQYTTPECESLLPDTLQDYLWQLALACGAKKQIFALRGRDYGCGEVQEILHRRNHFSSFHQVFGYKPVDGVVEVTIGKKDSVMQMLDSTGKNEKEAVGCCV